MMNPAPSKAFTVFKKARGQLIEKKVRGEMQFMRI